MIFNIILHHFFLKLKTKKYMNTNYLTDLNQFELLNKINGGPFATSYKIKEKQTNSIFIAKHFQKSLSEDDNLKAIQNLLQKSKNISNLDHPSIAKFIGFSSTDFHGEKTSSYY